MPKKTNPIAIPCCRRAQDGDSNCDRHPVTVLATDYFDNVHERTKLLRTRISMEEPPVDHPDHKLWMALLDIEFYCGQVMGELLKKPH